MQKLKNKGFTLIELLVVIAIISLLSSVVLASLNSARAKAADAAIKANLANLRVQAGIYYDGPIGNGSYGLSSTCVVTPGGTAQAGCIAGNVTGGDNTFLNGLKSAASASGNDAYANVTATAPVAWAAFVKLKTVSTSSHCVDSTGASRVVANPVTTVTVCPAS